MPDEVFFRVAVPADLPAVMRLLEDAALPPDGLEEFFGSGYIVVPSADGSLAGVAGLEVRGRHGFLRSVVVSDALRRRGVGESLVRDRIAWARARNLAAVHLLTTSAAPYFTRFGFERVSRDSLPPEIRASVQFTTACPESAVAMSLWLAPAHRRKDERMTHVERVQQIYEAFGRGDIPAILSHLSDDVVWEYGSSSTDVPWLQPRRGRGDVSKFFETLGALQITKFEVKLILSGGDVVLSLIDLQATVKATGKPLVEEDQVHVWYFNDAGQVVKFRHRVDTHQHLMASRR